MRFRPRIKFTNVTPPPPPVVEGIQGWGSTYNSGAKVQGGEGGDIENFNESTTYDGFTGFDALVRFARNVSEPTILRWTGGDIISGDYQTIVWGTESGAKTQNKTIISANGVWMEKRENDFSYVSNVILRNWKFRNTSNDYAIERDAVRFRYSQGIWVDHCEFDGEGTWDNDYLDVSITDGSLDATKETDLATFSNCLFKRSGKTSLIGASNLDTSDSGKLRITYDRCLFQDAKGRTPFARFGQIHLLNCAWDWDVLPTLYTVFIELGLEAQILVENCNFIKGRWVIRDREEGANLGGVKTILSLLGTLSASSDSPPNYISLNLRDSNVTFDPASIPNYIFNPMPASEVEAYVKTWAGAKYHLKYPTL
jgi:pectate lyase